MHTKCPRCNALFRVNVKQLHQAQGSVRCGQCSTLFDAQNNIVLPKAGEMLSDLDAVRGRRSKAHAKRNAPTPPSARIGGYSPDQEDIPLPKLIPEEDKNTPRQLVASTNTGGSLSNNAAINITTDSDYSSGRSSYLLALSSVALILLLLAQFIYFYQDQLSKRPLLASFMTDACDMIGCIIEPIRDIDRIEVISRNVFSHPREENALMITATFANVAPFPQPYPIMQVALTDLQGNTVAARRFLPNEYLNKINDGLQLMQPGTPVDVNLEVLDPRNGAMAFEFNFFDHRS